MRKRIPLFIHLIGLIGLAGCDTRPIDGEGARPDLAIMPDAAITADLAAPADLFTADDMACPKQCWGGCINGACPNYLLRCSSYSNGSFAASYAWVTDTGVYTRVRQSAWLDPDPPPGGTTVMLDQATLAALKAAIHSVATGNAGSTTKTWQVVGFVRWGELDVYDGPNPTLVDYLNVDGNSPQMRTETHADDPMAAVIRQYDCILW